MPVLVANIGPLPRQLTLSKLEVPCSLTEELYYSAYVGKSVLIGYAVSYGGPLQVFAQARLDGFTSTDRQTRAVLTGLVMLAQELEYPNHAPDAVFSIQDDNGDAIRPGSVTPMRPGEESLTAFIQLETYGQLGQQISSSAQRLCAFSGVSVAAGDGAATPIIPFADGGSAHASNLIFLHDEPAHTFTRFAWTVGPDFEIIVDAWAMGSDILFTVNPGGKLILGEDRARWPDHEALARHRHAFFDRLR